MVRRMSIPIEGTLIERCWEDTSRQRGNYQVLHLFIFSIIIEYQNKNPHHAQHYFCDYRKIPVRIGAKDSKIVIL